jgi:hypothetical protein
LTNENNCQACHTCNTVGVTVLEECGASTDATCQCAQGYVGNPADSCNPCVGTEYQDDLGQSVCKACPDGATGTADADAGGNTGCETSTCNRPAAPTKAVIDSANCPDNAQQGSTCTLKCAPGYKRNSVTPYTCTPVQGTADATYQGGSINCTLNQCTCVNGHGSTGVACPTDGDPHCATCDAGYLLNGDACAIKACLCDNGQGAEGDACPGMGAQKCASCNSGYLLDNELFTCSPRMCSCENGVAASGALCPSAGASKCTTCSAGFYMSTGACVPNNCTCDNGMHAVGKACPSNQGHRCVNCHDGFQLSSEGLCQADPEPMACNEELQGFVNLGTDITGLRKSCSVSRPFVNEENSCSTTVCTVLADRITCCRAKACVCPNGIATVAAGENGTLCERDGETDCSSCDGGYHLSAPAALGAQICKPNVCKCPNGEATRYDNQVEPGMFCEANDRTDCSSCNPGYHMSAAAATGGQSCIANTCTCANGIPTVAWGKKGTLCETHNTEDCSSCDAGYAIDSTAALGIQKCRGNVCSTDDLPTGDKFDTTGCANMKPTQSCHVICGESYTGADATYVCGTNGRLNGTKPTCEACSPSLLQDGDRKIKAANHRRTPSWSSPDIPECEEGSSGVNACGVNGTHQECKPRSCDASANITNGNAGTCTSNLISGGTCTPTCDAGYMLSGVTSCLAGIVTHATCEPRPCYAGQAVAPQNGALGDCAETVHSGESCLFVCDDGYTSTGNTTCETGVITPATCRSKLTCNLQFGRKCDDNYGHWTENPAYLDYEGCEQYCDLQNELPGSNVLACELSNVASANRATKGLYCLAHLRGCSSEGAVQNAAASCLPTATADSQASSGKPSSLLSDRKKHHRHRH